MTHNTEVEEKIKALRPKLLPTIAEMDLYEREVIKVVDHQLQKAREEMLHKLYLCAIGKYEGDALENVKAQIAEYQAELDQPNN